MSGAGLQSGVANLSAFYRAVAAIASGVNQTVRLPRARRPASYSGYGKDSDGILTQGG